MADLREALQQLVERQDLSRAEARALLVAIFAAPAVAAQPGRDILVAGILAALAAKGETVEEIVGFAEGMRAAVADIGLTSGDPHGVDLCGTGGRARAMFNISTAAALVAAGAGLYVAKHGNRTSTGISGSADVLEAAGVNLTFPPDQLANCLRSTGIVFLYAPLLHPAMRHVMPARKGLQIRTVFNVLGPLTNPAGARAQVVGVPYAALLPKLAQALLQLGTDHSLVVYSEDGLGELSTSAHNQLAEVRNGEIRHFRLDAQDLGIKRADVREFGCASRAEAVAKLQFVLSGQEGPLADIVSLNAAAALVVGGLAKNWEEGLGLARQALRTGAARQKLEALVQFTAQPRTAEAEVGGGSRRD